MKPFLKMNCLAVLILSAVFYWFFNTTKHDPSLAPLVPFGDDPFDAIGSFCTILSVPLTILAGWRAFKSYPPTGPTKLQETFLLRVQAAVAFGVLVTLAADGVAMARHPSQWIGKSSTGELLALVCGTAAVSAFVLILIGLSARSISIPRAHLSWGRAVTFWLASLVILAFFPEAIIQSVFAHFLTIVLGNVLIAAPQAAFTTAFLPIDTAWARTNSVSSKYRLWVSWGAVALLGLATGASIGALELFGEGGQRPALSQVLLVGSVFTGGGLALLLVAFAFFRSPLGLFYRPSQT